MLPYERSRLNVVKRSSLHFTKVGQRIEANYIVTLDRKIAKQDYVYRHTHRRLYTKLQTPKVKYTHSPTSNTQSKTKVTCTRAHTPKAVHKVIYTNTPPKLQAHTHTNTFTYESVLSLNLFIW